MGKHEGFKTGFYFFLASVIISNEYKKKREKEKKLYDFGFRTLKNDF